MTSRSTLNLLLSLAIYKTLEKHSPLQSKIIREIQAPFMNKELSKAIIEKSRLLNSHLKYPSSETFSAYKKIKNKCNNLLKQIKRKDISNK